MLILKGLAALLTYEWESAFEFQSALNKWVEDYNTHFPHMSLGYQTRRQFTENTPLVAS